MLVLKKKWGKRQNQYTDFLSSITPGDPSWMLMESLALLLYINLNITWLFVCEEQMHSSLFNKDYQGHVTERSNKDSPVTVPQTQHLFSAEMFIFSNVILILDKNCATLLCPLIQLRQIPPFHSGLLRRTQATLLSFAE